MKAKKMFLSFLIALLAFSLSSCSKDNGSNPVTPEKKEPAKLQMKEVTLPEHLLQVTDPHAQMAVAFVQMANGFRNYSPFFNPPSGSTFTPGENGEWTWQEGDLTIKLVYNEGTDMISWKIYLTGSFEGYTVSNWLGAEAEQANDGKSGHLLIYEPGTSNILSEWNWNIDATGTYHFEFTNLADFQKLVVTVNIDNSGVLEFYVGNENQNYMQYKITWTANGSGQWWEYDSLGTIVAQGSWI